MGSEIDELGADRNFNLLMQIQAQQGKIEGILQTVVTEHARRLGDLDLSNRQLRVDLTAVKDEGERRIAGLSDRIQIKWDSAVTDGSKKYSDVMSVLAEHKSELFNIKQDVKVLEDNGHNLLSKAAIVLSPVVSVGALLWSILSNHH